ncbi:MAG: DUF202 domain-containing protein [Candidatus Heimdallarchaeaceae archaeon]
MNSAMEIIKRKQAQERSIMANIRTSLSMINTSLLFLISSIILIKLFPGDVMITITSLACLTTGIVTGFFSIYYFRRTRKASFG